MAQSFARRRMVRNAVGAALVAVSALTVHAQNTDRSKDKDDRRRPALPSFGPTAAVPACYNLGSGSWRVVGPWSATISQATACRPPAPWDSVNVPKGGW